MAEEPEAGTVDNPQQSPPTPPPPSAPPREDAPEPAPAKKENPEPPAGPTREKKAHRAVTMGYEGQNKRALIWASVYFLAWILQRLWCHLGLPDHCDLALRPLDVLTDLVVLFTFCLAQAYWCEILLDSRFEELMKAPWIFGVILVTPLIISALGRISGLRPWDRTNPGEDFEFSAIRSTLFVFGLIAAVLLTAWHFARAWLTLPGMQLLSGGIKIEKPEEDLHGIYASSRIIVVAWSILFASFIISEDDGFDYRGALLAWVLSLIAVFPHPVSYLWLSVNTGIFLQGIGANRLRFLGCEG